MKCKIEGDTIPPEVEDPKVWLKSVDGVIYMGLNGEWVALESTLEPEEVPGYDCVSTELST